MENVSHRQELSVFLLTDANENGNDNENGDFHAKGNNGAVGVDVFYGFMNVVFLLYGVIFFLIFG